MGSRHRSRPGRGAAGGRRVPGSARGRCRRTEPSGRPLLRRLYRGRRGRAERGDGAGGAGGAGERRAQKVTEKNSAEIRTSHTVPWGSGGSDGAGEMERGREGREGGGSPRPVLAWPGSGSELGPKWESGNWNRLRPPNATWAADRAAHREGEGRRSTRATPTALSLLQVAFRNLPKAIVTVCPRLRAGFCFSRWAVGRSSHP